MRNLNRTIERNKKTVVLCILLHNILLGIDTYGIDNVQVIEQNSEGSLVEVALRGAGDHGTISHNDNPRLSRRSESQDPSEMKTIRHLITNELLTHGISRPGNASRVPR